MITWMGVLSDEYDGHHVYISTMRGSDLSSRALRSIEVRNDATHLRRLRSGELRPEKDISGVVPRSGKAGMRRLASTMGWNIGARGVPDIMHHPDDVPGCVCAYDIEVDTSPLEGDSFVLPDSEIISCALYCSCGLRLSINTMGVTGDTVRAVEGSAELVYTLLDAILDHKPQWLIGWNNFAFDNFCLAYWCKDSEYEKYFEAGVVMASSGSKDAYSIDIPMVYNVDMYVYMDKSPGRRSNYERMSLAVVAETEGVSLKTSMPSPGDKDYAFMMIEYNMNDSMVTYQLWSKLRLGDEILSLSAVACTPVQDTCRFITGCLAECAVASYCYSRGISYCWQKRESAGKFSGGYVMEPTRGVHDNVAVCDFKSMYPTLFACCNIGPESLYIGPAESGVSEGAITWNEKCVSFHYNGASHSFAFDVPAVLPEMEKSMMTERDKWRKKKPYYAAALKITANSMYGVCGYDKSPMYSPSCSQSITLAGRWCTALTIGVFSLCGMDVVYGDTDSVMVKTRSAFKGRYGNVEYHRTVCIQVLHHILSYTPFHMMRLEPEPVHRRMLTLEKKMYATMSESGAIMYKGISAVRKDTIGVCREVCKAVVSSILRRPTEPEACRDIALIICPVLDASALGLLRLRDVCSTVRSGGRTVYAYPGIEGDNKELPVEGTDTSAIVRYNRARVSKAVVAEASRYTRAAGYGGLHDAMVYCDPFACVGF